MTKVTKLTPVENTPSEEVVVRLTELLEAAVRGEVNGFIGVAFMTGGEQNIISKGTYSVPQAVYAIEVWKHRELKRMLEDAGE